MAERPNLNAALLILRIASSATFLFHGSQILFGFFGGGGPQSVSSSFHAPILIGYLVGLAEIAGGLAILSGVLFRVGATCIIIVMLGAIFAVHIKNGFDSEKDGIEFAFDHLLIALALLLTGSGSYSLSRILPPALRKW